MKQAIVNLTLAPQCTQGLRPLLFFEDPRYKAVYSLVFRSVPDPTERKEE
jgi:hypothetical protein